MKVLVTGASGFLGRSLVRALLAEGRQVVATHRRAEPPFQAEHLSWYPVQLGADTHWDDLLEDVSTVYHLAWSTLPQSANDEPVRDACENIVGSVRLIEAASHRAALRFVFVSSGGTVYGAVPAGRVSEDAPKHPMTAYGVSKLAVEAYLELFHRLHGLDATILRLANPYGPEQELGRNFGVVATFAARALRDEPCTIFGDGSTERDFVYIDDAVRSLLLAGRDGAKTGTYNIGSGEGRSITQVVAAIEDILGRPVQTVNLPARAFDAPRSVLDFSRARAELGWSPTTSFEDGLRLVVSAHRQAQAGP